jgi:ComF family protein
MESTMSHNEWLDKTAEFFFPSALYCIACGNLIDETRPYALCDSCVREIGWTTGHVCEKCGKALPIEDMEGADRSGGTEGFQKAPHTNLCHDCGEFERSFRRGYSCATYDGRAADIIRDMKYRSKPWIARKIARIMRDKILSVSDPDTGELIPWDLLIPAPMNIIKKRKRGYDQAALIAKFLSKEIGVPCAEGLLVRNRSTDVMSALSADERRANLTGAFSLVAHAEDRIRGKDVLLIDDVFTTGSTSDACAEALLSGGAKNVDVFIFASGADKSRPGLWL